MHFASTDAYRNDGSPAVSEIVMRRKLIRRVRQLEDGPS
jgi:hypothetical protein